MPTTKLTLKAARVNAGLTQQQVAEQTGIARSTLIRWEKGLTKPSKPTLAGLCALYHILPDQLATKTRR